MSANDNLAASEGAPPLGLSGHQLAVVKDLADKVSSDVSRAMMRTVALVDSPAEMMPLMLAGLRPVITALAELLKITRENLDAEACHRLAIEIAMIQLDFFAGTPLEVAHERAQARLAAAGLAHVNLESVKL
jgi:hypothetical protein